MFLVLIISDNVCWVVLVVEMLSFVGVDEYVIGVVYEMLWW